tara:strand:- start:41264 stop:41815 length:552 start_codon:yes stop_codon:yes gene_type:complete
LQTNKIILGIDPGTSLLGYGLIQIKEKKISLINMGVIHLSKLQSHEIKLKKIFSRILNLIDEYKPDEVAIEAPFYGKNVQSMLKLGRAQGVAMAASLYRDVPIFEYAPKKIKMSITGNGNASKEQVAGMLKSILNIKEMPKNLDASDGLAAALCHYYQNKTINSSSNYSNWKSFIKNNPNKIK